MDPFTDLLACIASGHSPGPFALLRRQRCDLHGASADPHSPTTYLDGPATGQDGPTTDHLDLLTGDLTTVAELADIPLPAGRPGPATLALVPFRQVVERGFACVDDATPLECLRVTASHAVPLATALAALPEAPPRCSPGAFDLDDTEYAGIVTSVLADEIGRGEGANFVIHRVYEAGVDGAPLVAALAALRRLLRDERGAYWTFLVHTGTRTLVGATPERHVSVDDGLVMMNPISGTHRHGPTGPDVEDLLRFLDDRKEVEELYMVLDEELKMMAAVAAGGGQVLGPYLKPMAHLTHTEYLLAGRTDLDVRDVLRETMFAPTVTGSPIENALRVIARHERRGRGYYAGVLALLGHDDAGRQTLDAPILIRTAEISPAGALRVPVGATLVRHSTPAGEVAETHTKAAGVLAALGVVGPGPTPDVRRVVGGDPVRGELADDPRVRAALAARNDHLARFWLDDRGAVREPGNAPLTGRRALIVDAEDTFTGMLAHQLRALGLDVAVRPYTDAGLDAELALGAGRWDLVVAGPGPGDPEDLSHPKMARVRGLVGGLLRQGHPVLGVCLGHQILAGLLGLTMLRRPAPYQGLQREVEMFGARRRVGFYATFTPVAGADRLSTPYGVAELARDPADGTVHALRGPRFAGVQFHPESVLSPDGLAVLAELAVTLLPGTDGRSAPPAIVASEYPFG